MKSSINFEVFKQSISKPRYTSAPLESIISHKIKFETESLKEFLSDLKKKELKFEVKKEDSFTGLELTNEKELKQALCFGNKIYDFRVGGLHSRNKNEVYRSTESQRIVDVDVTSYYPSLMINNSYKPDFLNEKWTTIYSNLKDERIKAKRAGDKLKSDALKIVLNSIFGKYNSIYFYAHDPKTAYSITINGQLMLLKLIEMFETNGIQVVSANTDGVTVLLDKSKQEIFNNIKTEWEIMFDLELEEVYYSVLCMENVNNYFAEVEKQ